MSAKGGNGRDAVTAGWMIVDEAETKIERMTQDDFDLAVMLFGEESARSQWETANKETRSSA